MKWGEDDSWLISVFAHESCYGVWVLIDMQHEPQQIDPNSWVENGRHALGRHRLIKSPARGCHATKLTHRGLSGEFHAVS